MHSSLVAALVIVTASVSAAPAHPISIRAGSCNINSCVTALGPSFPACAPAVAEEGANTPSNTACLAAAAKGTAAFPSACSPCAAPFGVTDPGNKPQEAPTVNGPQGASPASDNHVKRAGPGKPPAGGQPPAPAAPPPKVPKALAAGPPPADNAKPADAVTPLAPQSRADTCDIQACVIALGPSFPACAPAVTAQGASAYSRQCSSALDGSAAFPSPCAPCAAPFGVTDPAKKSQGAATTNNPNAGSPASKNNAAPADAAAPASPVPRANTCDVQGTSGFNLLPHLQLTSSPPCVIALGPSFPACAPAVSQLGANTAFNSACITAAAKGSSPFPSACGGCATQFDVIDPGTAVKAPAAGANANGHV
ncbi:hypothetical protein B0H17DRAFT_1216084 [Mycena rosella]|uniref:Uncharacterized protein n=1 Tax=Mycena rosella TaxID=1033263 RepID=A0AAD7FVF7_MYCRO|nr:hypothetical protein B0H17DRAFT_1216084 [Mycena rosella]